MRFSPRCLPPLVPAGQWVCLEVYTFEDSPLGRRFREALVRARERNVRVRVLVDAIGSIRLSNHFWDPLRQAGGEARIFNAIDLRRVIIRAITGSCSCATSGWRLLEDSTSRRPTKATASKAAGAMCGCRSRIRCWQNNWRCHLMKCSSALNSVINGFYAGASMAPRKP